MERKIISELIKWRADNLKKPLLLYGLPGCGKTYTVLEFGKSEYKNTIYFDCSGNLELSYVFEKNNTLEKLIRGLSAISLETIFQEESLIVFDNINEKTMKAVKKLFSDTNLYHVILISNSEDFVQKNKGTEIIIKRMNLVNFEEYLKYIGKEQLVEFIEDSFKNNKPMPFHALAYECYNDFLLTGGYPETIMKFNEEQNYNLLSSYHDKNLKLLKNRFFDLDNLIDIKRCNEILDNISFQLLKDNKKFLYGLVKPNGRAKDYGRAIDFLDKNHLIIKSNKVDKIASPLSKIKDDDSFKLYFCDSGLLYKKMNVSSNRLLTNDKLLHVLYENNVVATLSQNGFNIYYYHSEGKSELDLVIQTRTGKIIPIEMIDEANTKSKSLSLTMSKYEVPMAIRFTTGNFVQKKTIKYIPYYAAFLITESM